MTYYYDPRNRRPYKERMRNRCIAAGVFIILCVFIASCIFGEKAEVSEAKVAEEQLTAEPAAQTPDTLTAEAPATAATEIPAPAATDANAAAPSPP